MTKYQQKMKKLFDDHFKINQPLNERENMLKSYKVVFNKNEMLVEDNALNNAKIIQNTKKTSKNQYTIYLVAKDMYDCLSKAKEVHFDRFNSDAKSIEVEKLSKKHDFNSPEIINNAIKNLVQAVTDQKEVA